MYALQSGIKTIEVASSKSSLPDFTAETTSLTDIAVWLGVLLFLDHSIMLPRGHHGRDK